MGKSLVIVESPAKARTISRFLGDEYEVLASMGHIRDLPQKKFGVDLENEFAPEYELNKERKKIIDELKKAAKAVETIYLAPDPDREGEAIAWHLEEILKEVSKADFRRVTFHEITKSAINKAFDDSHEVDSDKVNAQQARRVLDRIVGWQVSDFLRRRVFGATSAGRVQTVALRLICERESDILAFVTREYWSLKVKLAKDNGVQFISNLAKLDGKKPEIPNGEFANELRDELEKAIYKVVSIISKDRRQKASAPFITSTLQQAASSSLRLSPTQSMRVAQQLYEGVDLGIEGTAGLITYMRTDSFSISKEAQEAARDFVASEYGSEYLPEKPNSYKSKSSAQEAHEAIRPTDVTRTPEKMAKFLDTDQLKLYSIIWKRFVASQMSKAVFKQETVEIEATGDDCTHKYLFRTTASRNTFPGYLKVYSLKEEGEEADEDLEKTIPPLTKGEDCQREEFLLKQHFTEPPPRFSEATLVKELEANGVGRPSTYAATVKTIQAREYVDKKEGRMHPSKIGMESSAYLTQTIPTLFEVKFTAQMEDKLDEVESGKLSWTSMLGEFYGNFSTWLTEAKTAGAPPKEHFEKVLSLFSDSIEYSEPEKKGRRTYSDEKFVTSLRETIENDKDLTKKQWDGVIRMAVKYEKQLASLGDVIEGIGAKEAYDDEVALQEQKRIAAENPDVASLRLIAFLDDVTFDKAKKVGKRTYDDSLFKESLKGQALSGKILSENQINALKKLLSKYQTQISDFNTLAAELKIPTLEENAEANKEIVALLSLFDEVTEWNEPTKKGRFTYDDKEFSISIRSQFAEKGSLSERQLAAAKKTLGKYKEQIPDFENKAKELNIVAETKETGVNCPECDKPILKRQSRGRTFFGCSGFPKCKYLVNDLESVPQK
jgi:DNA topoisomerase I